MRRVLTVVMFAGMVGSFALAIRNILRLADRYCGIDEGGGNCHAIAEYFAKYSAILFAIFALGLAILIFFPKSRSADK